ncbi:MAG: hypothetical protein A3J52_01945 [Omnitrophica bacterium RIFCSPHIGHO2_02_FULL_49_9]|nr:MAG: hypothetical protein A3J52_01945 [Omnitrophica bacterium RIFCSPHIGHO2_02_FULL_49_9]OGW89933.1 MAG: hypothetical protein A3A73_01975 [Omnitrophica bacterium RIFCSPLOWO2_01_FULL_50_24]
MPRKKRQSSPTGIYHWITRGINRKNLFRCPKDYVLFLNLVGEYSKRFDTQIYHYSLMTNHVHILIHVETLENLIGFSHYLKRKYAYYQAKEYKVLGSTFERMYRSKPVGEEVYLLECARYIDRNPLRAGLVEHLADYPYGSYRTYAEGVKNNMITPSPAYLALAAKGHERQKLYSEYILQHRPQEEFANSNSIVQALIAPLTSPTGRRPDFV